MNLKCYVVDDEAHCVKSLVNLIEKCSGLELVGTNTDPIVAREEIWQLKPDIVFTDMNMNKMDGITLAGHIDSIAQVVIVSGNPQHYFKNLDWKNYIYVLKGMGDSEFRSIISGIRLRLDK